MGVVAVEESDPLFRAVIALAKKAKGTVGFLRDGAFADRARQGTLLALVDDDQLAAYVLYDLPRSEIRIVQLVVDEGHRSGGHARALVDHLAGRHPERRGISLDCRRDYPAHHMWPKLGFTPTAERVGNSFDGRLLTRWWKSFGHPDLFSLLLESDRRPVAALDSCVFFDLIAEVPTPVAEQLRADWLAAHVRLAITDEVLVEINQGHDDAERKRQRSIASRFEQLNPPQPAWLPFLQAIRTASPDTPTSDEKDLRQLARALASGASWLISTDRALRRRYSTVAVELGGLRVASPEEFLREIDAASRDDWYRPVELADTSVTCREVDSETLRVVGEKFVNHSAGETLTEFRTVVAHAASRPKQVRLMMVEVDGAPRGLVCYEVVGPEIQVGLVRVTAGRGDTTIGRHLLGLLRDTALALQVPIVRILDRTLSGPVERSLVDEGFVSSEAGHLGVALSGIGSLSDLRRSINELDLSTEDRRVLLELGEVEAGDSNRQIAALAESRFSRFRVIGTDLPTYLVPIRHSWATSLFDSELSAGQLFKREWELGLRRELIYYRSARNSGGIAAPARIFWYASGSEPGARTIRGVSLLTEVVVGSARHLWNRFSRLGTFTLSQVLERADDNGRAMALRFTAPELFSSPVALDDYREMLTGDPKSKNVFLLSPQKLDDQLLVGLLQRGAGSE